jgi:hypothetical protein
MQNLAGLTGEKPYQEAIGWLEIRQEDAKIKDY